MKKLFLLAIITALMATAASAQETKAQGPTRVSYTESELKLKYALKLTADQSQKYDAIFSAFNAKSQALAQSTTISQEAKNAKMKTMKEEKETKIRELLTPEQLTKYNAIQEKTPLDKKPAS